MHFKLKLNTDQEKLWNSTLFIDVRWNLQSSDLQKKY